MSAKLKIGEFARLTGLSVKALRFYAEAGVLHPSSVDATS
ncbi:MAG: MerR family DNA-binding transcriptional regulator, partial [Pseudomonadota bacterium]